MNPDNKYTFKYILLTRDGDFLGNGRISSPLEYASWDIATEIIKKHNEEGAIEGLDVPCFVMFEREPYSFSKKSRVFECTAVVELVIDATVCELDEEGEDSPTFEEFMDA